jgi:hypothetical protein
VNDSLASLSVPLAMSVAEWVWLAAAAPMDDGVIASDPPVA